jgi:hypothetical protein
MPTIGEIFRAHGPAYLEAFGEKIPPLHRRAIANLAACRTGELGWHVYECPDCGEVHYVNHSCRNRSCPLCHARRREEWLAARLNELLPTRYFHVIFTVPEELRRVIRAHPRLLLATLLSVAGKSLLKLTSDKKFLGGQTGATMVLHTWSSTLEYHPHVHCLVPAGGIDGFLWRDSRKGFLVPVKALSRIFRGMFLDILRQALPDLEIPPGVLEKEWVVYAKPAPRKAEILIRYLGRYVHRVAISNGRILSMADGKVTFQWKDSRDAKNKVMVLPVFEFMRRFLQHVLPSGFHKIRYFGFMSPSNKRLFRRVQVLLWLKAGFPHPAKQALEKEFRCNSCGNGVLMRVGAYYPSARSPP